MWRGHSHTTPRWFPHAHPHYIPLRFAHRFTTHFAHTIPHTFCHIPHLRWNVLSLLAGGISPHWICCCCSFMVGSHCTARARTPGCSALCAFPGFRGYSPVTLDFFRSSLLFPHACTFAHAFAHHAFTRFSATHYTHFLVMVHCALPCYTALTAYRIHTFTVVLTAAAFHNVQRDHY